jgi:hypothetical protein
VAFLCVLAAWAWRRRPEPQAALTAGIAGAILAAPIAWTGYTLMFLPFLLTRPWSLRLRVSAMLLLLPDVVLWTARGAVLLPLAGSLYTIAVLLVLLEVAHWTRDSRAPARTT